MRIEVIVDGTSLGKSEFLFPPRPGDLVEADSGVFVVDRLCHFLPQNRAQVLCKAQKAKGPHRPIGPAPAWVPPNTERDPTKIPSSIVGDDSPHEPTELEGES